MALIVFDLDHTLLNSEKLRHELAHVFGLSTDEYERHYRENFSNKNLSYSFEEHLELLKNDDAYKDREELNNAKVNLEKLLSRLDDFLKEGALDLLKDEKNRENKMILLTFGDLDWQKEKILNLNKLNQYFSEENIHFVEEEKGAYLKKTFPGEEKFIIYNDNVRESIEIVNSLGAENCEVFIIKSKYSHSEEDLNLAKENGFKVYENIRDVLKSENRETSLEYGNALSGENIFR